ncbi:MAG: hypothetical protein Q9161_006815 [Pseudevernia consocians]
MSSAQMALEYLLVYCTSHGLTTIGEPPLPKTYQPVGESLLQTSRANKPPNSNSKDAMPVWTVLVFLILATFKYCLSFVVWYVYQVISTVVIVADRRIRTIAAANAHQHPESHRARVDSLVQTMRVIKRFRAAGADRLRKLSVGEVRQDLKRRDTMKEGESTAKPSKSAVMKAWNRITSYPCFRGFIGYLYMAVPQWYFGMVCDFFLSGQPSELSLGYGTTSIVLATMWGSGLATWTHYTMTPPRKSIRVQDHFPKGPAVLTDLWPLTASWLVAEHLTLSLPLALSRTFRLKHYAFDVDSWNTLDEYGQNKKIMQFALVLIFYLLLVAVVAIPATMTMRRVHASMLSDDDLAIVPFHRGDRARLHPYDQRTQIRQPGLTVAEAFNTITWDAYLRVLFVYFQYFAINQLVQLAYWSANWKLHQILEVHKYASTNLPCSPVNRLLPFAERNVSTEAYRGFFHPNPHSEL